MNLLMGVSWMMFILDLLARPSDYEIHKGFGNWLSHSLGLNQLFKLSNSLNVYESATFGIIKKISLMLLIFIYIKKNTGKYKWLNIFRLAQLKQNKYKWTETCLFPSQWYSRLKWNRRFNWHIFQCHCWETAGSWHITTGLHEEFNGRSQLEWQCRGPIRIFRTFAMCRIVPESWASWQLYREM